MSHKCTAEKISKHGHHVYSLVITTSTHIANVSFALSARALSCCTLLAPTGFPITPTCDGNHDAYTFIVTLYLSLSSVFELSTTNNLSRKQNEERCGSVAWRPRFVGRQKYVTVIKSSKSGPCDMSYGSEAPRHRRKERSTTQT
jgi:hypothetical protein